VGKWGGPGGRSPHGGGHGGCAPFTPTEVSLFEKGRPAPTLIKLGVEGAQPPPRGFGGCAPKIKKRGRVAHISHPTTSGTQATGKPSAHEGGQMGGPGGRSPHGRGLWGMCPFRPNPLTPFPAREGGNFSPPRFGEGPGERLTRHEWDPKRWRTLIPRGWGIISLAPPPFA
jgi:hypothetical protein